MESGTTRRLALVGLGSASVVLLGNGIPMIIAAVVNIVFVHSLAAIGLGLVLAATGVGLIAAAIRLYTGSHRWWLVSLGLLPVAAAFQFFDAYVLGDGRVPFVSGIVMPAAAVTCLLLRPVRTLVVPAGPPAKGGIRDLKVAPNSRALDASHSQPMIQPDPTHRGYEP